MTTFPQANQLRLYNWRAAWWRFSLRVRSNGEKYFCQGFSQFVGLGLLVITSPVWLWRILQAVRQGEPIFQRTLHLGYRRQPFYQLTFHSPAFGKSLPLLLNVILGDLRLTGPRSLTPPQARALTVPALVRFNLPPGLISTHQLHKRLGIDYQTESEDDQAFVYTAHWKNRLGLLLRAGLTAFFTPRQPLATPQQIDLLQIPVYNTTMAEAIDYILMQAQQQERCLIAFVNADCMNIAFRNAAYRQVLQNASRVFADGVGLRIGCRMLGMQLLGNVNGTDLFPQLCEKLQNKEITIFLLGASPGVAALVAENMQGKYPGLQIVGHHHGFFSEAETSAVIKKINDSSAQILLVAFGAPRQELWLSRYHQELVPSVCIGVGGLFDFYSGRIPRAPMWMRELGLEWTWRLLQEPQRMWRRYLVGNPLFLYRVWRQATLRKSDYFMMRYPLKSSFFGRSWQQIRAISQIWYVLNAKTVGIGAKRGFDVIVSAALLLILLPFFLLTIMAVCTDSYGNPFFFQWRVGRNGKSFRMWKFRSMYIDAEARKTALMKKNEMAGGVLFKMKEDPRITRIGKFIRKFSVDEMPQLWNVFVGDMSLVGPRPPLPHEVKQYTPYQRQRLTITPGITCIWQVSGRSDIPFNRQVEMDLDYINQQSFFLDMKLLFLTIPAVLRGRGAY